MIMIIAAIPLVETQVIVVNNLLEAKVAVRKKIWRDEFSETILEFYNTYKITEIQLLGPFEYIDNLAHQIQKLLPYDDYELIVNVDDKMSDAMPVKDAPKEFLTYDAYVNEIKADVEKKNEERFQLEKNKLVGLDGKPLEVVDAREFQ